MTTWAGAQTLEVGQAGGLIREPRVELADRARVIDASLRHTNTIKSTKDSEADTPLQRI